MYNYVHKCTMAKTTQILIESVHFLYIFVHFTPSYKTNVQNVHVHLQCTYLCTYERIYVHVHTWESPGPQYATLFRESSSFSYFAPKCYFI